LLFSLTDCGLTFSRYKKRDMPSRFLFVLFSRLFIGQIEEKGYTPFEINKREADLIRTQSKNVDHQSTGVVEE